MLKERLNLLGKIGCAICLLGSTSIVIHSPKEEEVSNMADLATKMKDAGKIYLFNFFYIYIKNKNYFMNKINYFSFFSFYFICCICNIIYICSYFICCAALWSFKHSYIYFSVFTYWLIICDFSKRFRFSN